MANEKRLTDTETVIRKLRNANCAECNVVRKIQCSACWVDDVVSLLEDAPTVDAVEVVHGRWMVSRDSDISKDVWCTACGEGFYIRKKIGAVLIDKMPYCPNCGAKMDGERKDNG